MEDSGLNNPFFSLSALLRILVELKLRNEEVMEGPKRNPFLHDADKSIRDILKSCQLLVSQHYSYLLLKPLRTFLFFSDVILERSNSTECDRSKNRWVVKLFTVSSNCGKMQLFFQPKFSVSRNASRL